MTKRRPPPKKKPKKAESPSEEPSDTTSRPKQQKSGGRGGNRQPRTSVVAPATVQSDSVVKTVKREEKVATTVKAPVNEVVAKEPNAEVRPSRPETTSRAVRVRSSSECATASTRPRDNSELKKVNISVDNDPITRRRIPIDYFKPPKNEPKDSNVESKESSERPPVAAKPSAVPKPPPHSRSSRGRGSRADNDMNWRTKKATRGRVPPNVKGLLDSEKNADDSDKERAETFVEFTGGENLQLTANKNFMEVAVGEADLKDDDKRTLIWTMDGLIGMVNPVWREKKGKVSFDELLDSAVTCAQAMEESERDAVIADKGAELVKETVLWMRRLFFLFGCGAGFIAQDYIEDQTTEFAEISKLNPKSELECTLQYAARCANTLLVPESNGLLEATKAFQGMIELVEKEDVDELAKKNVAYALTSPVERLRFGRSISDDELFEIIDTSVTTDCGKYLWIVDRCPEKLKGSSRIVTSIIKGISLKRVSKDQRPARAYYTLMPQLLASLTEQELHLLAEEHAENRERKVENWPEMMYEGFLMSLPNIQSKPRDTSDIVLLKLIQTESLDDLKFFLLACALIAEFDPRLCRRIYDFSTDSFCTRLARVFMAHQLSPEKRSLLLKALMAFPEPFKNRLLAREGYQPELSLHHVVMAICMEMPKVPTTDIRNVGSQVIKELTTVLSPARMIKFAIIPCLSHQAARMRAACLLPELLAHKQLPEELLNEKSELKPADLVKIALDQYEEPQGSAPKARYAFIDNILKTIDGVLEGDVPQAMIDDINTAFEEKGLTWQQHYALAHITFPKSHQKLQVPEVPPVKMTLKGLTTFNATAVLQTWPNQEEVRAVFEKAVSGVFAKANKVLLAYVLLKAATTPESQIKEHTEFLKEFVEKTIDDTGCDEDLDDEEETVTEVTVTTEKTTADEKKDEEVVDKPQENDKVVDGEEKAAVDVEVVEKPDAEKDGVVKDSKETAAPENQGDQEIQRDDREKENEEVAEKSQENAADEGEKIEEKEESKAARDDEKDKEEGNDAVENKEDRGEEKKHATWLTRKLLEASDVDPELRRLVLSFAVGSSKYSQEAERIRDAVDAVVEEPAKKEAEEEPRTKLLRNLVEIVKKDYEERVAPKITGERLTPKKTEETPQKPPSAVEKPPPAPEEKIVIPVVSGTPPVTPQTGVDPALKVPSPLVSPASSCISVVHTYSMFRGFPFPPAKISAIVSGLDVDGVSCPQHWPGPNDEKVTRWILWFFQDVATVCGDFVGFLKSPDFLKSIFLPPTVRLSIGGRRPDIQNNVGRNPLPNREMRLHLELVTAVTERPGTLLGRVMDTVNDALGHYMGRYQHVPLVISRQKGRSPPGPPRHSRDDTRRPRSPRRDFNGRPRPRNGFTAPPPPIRDVPRYSRDDVRRPRSPDFTRPSPLHSYGAPPSHIRDGPLHHGDDPRRRSPPDFNRRPPQRDFARVLPSPPRPYIPSSPPARDNSRLPLAAYNVAYARDVLPDAPRRDLPSPSYQDFMSAPPPPPGAFGAAPPPLSHGVPPPRVTEFRRSRGSSDNASSGRGRGGPSFRGGRGRGDRHQQPVRQPERREEGAKRRLSENGGHRSTKQPMESVTLDGVSHNTYMEKFGDDAKFAKLKGTLKCHLRTLNRNQILSGDLSKPLVVQITGHQKDVDNAVHHVKQMFGLD